MEVGVALVIGVEGVWLGRGVGVVDVELNLAAMTGRRREETEPFERLNGCRWTGEDVGLRHCWNELRLKLRAPPMGNCEILL